MEAIAPGTVSTSVTHTAIPRSRIRRTSSSRFSSLLATTRSGRSPATAARSGFFVPRTRATSRSAGWVHQSVAPTRRSGQVAARASVREGTRETTRRGRARERHRHAQVVEEGHGGRQRGAIRSAPSIRMTSPLR